MDLIIYGICGLVGCAIGIVAEHKFDLLKPKHVARIEQELRELRDDIKEWIKEKI